MKEKELTPGQGEESGANHQEAKSDAEVDHIPPDDPDSNFGWPAKPRVIDFRPPPWRRKWW